MSGRRLILPVSVVTGDPATAIAEIKQRYDGDIAIHSSATLKQSLVETDLIDEVPADGLPGRARQRQAPVRRRRRAGRARAGRDQAGRRADDRDPPPGQHVSYDLTPVLDVKPVLDRWAERLSADMLKATVDANAYMTLATADAQGRPRVTTVWFAPVGYREFLWVSDPGATHSRNIAVRPEVSIVIFDSRQPIGRGEGVYLDARAEFVADAELDAALATFSQRTTAHGGRVWTRADVEVPARRRLYRAVLSQHYINDERDRRRPVAL